MSLGRILCQTVDIKKMLPKAFEVPSKGNNWTSCKQFKTMNLNAWKENTINFRTIFPEIENISGMACNLCNKLSM